MSTSTCLPKKTLQDATSWPFVHSHSMSPFLVMREAIGHEHPLFPRWITIPSSASSTLRWSFSARKAAKSPLVTQPAASSLIALIPSYAFWRPAQPSPHLWIRPMAIGSSDLLAVPSMSSTHSQHSLIVSSPADRMGRLYEYSAAMDLTQARLSNVATTYGDGMRGPVDDTVYYTDSCPLARVSKMIQGKWTMAMIHVLSDGPLRFSDIGRRMPMVSETNITHDLRLLENLGVVDRRVIPDTPVRVEYSLTEMGRDFLPIIDMMAEWADRYTSPDGDNQYR